MSVLMLTAYVLVALKFYVLIENKRIAAVKEKRRNTVSCPIVKEPVKYEIYYKSNGREYNIEDIDLNKREDMSIDSGKFNRVMAAYDEFLNQNKFYQEAFDALAV